MTAVQALIDTCRSRYLLGGLTEQRNRLAAGYTPGSGSLSFQYALSGMGVGSKLSIGLNSFYVWSTDASSNTVMVNGGEEGAFDAAASAGDIVRVNPRWTDRQIFDAINEDLLDLGSPAMGLYQVKTVTLVYNASITGYDLPGVTDVTQIMEVRYDEPNQYKRTPRLDSSDYVLERKNSTSDYSSTYSLKLRQGGWPGRNVNVLYRAPFTPYVAVTDDVLASGLGASMTDLPPMGAALRLGAGQEVRRNQIGSQGDTRRAEEVTAGAVGASWRGIAALRMQRIQSEASRLSAAYPDRLW